MHGAEVGPSLSPAALRHCQAQIEARFELARKSARYFSGLAQPRAARFWIKRQTTTAETASLACPTNLNCRHVAATTASRSTRSVE
jgi:hypothetical protein